MPRHIQPEPYVVGFLFSPDHKRVILIRKNRPWWQVGKLNGVGGHVEEPELSIQAMRREFEEEAGLRITDWESFAVLCGTGYHVTCYRAFSDRWHEAYSKTDEQILDCPVAGITERHDIVPNLSFLIPLALHEGGLMRPVVFGFKD